MKFTTAPIFGMMLIMFCNVSPTAQNARMDALGGNFCIEDLSTVFQNSSSSLYYSDVFQGTAYEDGFFGPVIGIKSIGKNVAVGFFANTQRSTNSIFYSDAKTFLDSTIDTITELPAVFPPYPHLFASVKLPFGILGGEVFFDKVSHTAITGENGTVDTLKKEIAERGFNVNASITRGIIGVYPFMTYSVPTMLGETISAAPDATAFSVTTANSSLKYGMELNLSPGQLFFTLGGVLFNEKYTFTSSRRSGAINAENGVTAVDVYAGVTAYPVDHMVLSLVYSFNRSVYTCDEMLASIMQRSNNVWTEKNHFTVASCEVEHRVPSLSLSLFFRSGVYWYITGSEWSTIETGEDYVYNENIKYPETVSQFIPTIGVGFKKGVITFDVASKLAGWSGVIAGFPVTTGTLTVDFKSMVRESCGQK